MRLPPSTCKTENAGPKAPDKQSTHRVSQRTSSSDPSLGPLLLPGAASRAASTARPAGLPLRWRSVSSSSVSSTSLRVTCARQRGKEQDKGALGGGHVPAAWTVGWSMHACSPACARLPTVLQAPQVDRPARHATRPSPPLPTRLQRAVARHVARLAQVLGGAAGILLQQLVRPKKALTVVRVAAATECHGRRPS